MDVKDVAIVIGGARGIGAAACRRLAHDGYDIVCGYQRSRTAAIDVVSDVKALGRAAIAVQVDVSDLASITALMDVARDAGRVRGLVNSAGAITTTGPLLELDLDAVRSDIDVNLLGVIASCRYAVEAMTGGGGTIVNVSSGAPRYGSPGTYVHYAAAKAGVDVFTMGLAREVAHLGIRVNAIAPGVVDTDFHPDAEIARQRAQSVPMGRAATAEEIAETIAWLCSDASSYTTGSVVRVAGGI